MNEKSFGYILVPENNVLKHLLYLRGIGYITDNPSFFIQRSTYPDYLVMCVISGNIIIEQYGKKRVLSTGKTCFMNLQDPHCYYSDPDDPCEILWVHFGGKPVFDLLPVLFATSEKDFCVFENTKISGLIRQCLSIYQTEHQNGYLQISSALYTLLMETLSSLHSLQKDTGLRQNEFQDQLDTYVFSHIHKKITLEDLAKEFHFTEAYFCRKVKATTGYTFSKYLLSKKIEIAKYKLLYTEEKLSDIADSLGFYDQSHFSYCFYKTVGVYPSKYRSEQKSNIVQYTVF